MARRVVPVGLVIAAAAADGAGDHGLAFYALLLAVPAAAVAALEAFGRVLDGRTRARRGWRCGARARRDRGLGARARPLGAARLPGGLLRAGRGRGDAR